MSDRRSRLARVPGHFTNGLKGMASEYAFAPTDTMLNRMGQYIKATGRRWVSWWSTVSRVRTENAGMLGCTT